MEKCGGNPKFRYRGNKIRWKMWSLSGRTLKAVISETNGMLEIARIRASAKMRRSSEEDLLSSDRGGSDDWFFSGLLVDLWMVGASQLCIKGAAHASGNN